MVRQLTMLLVAGAVAAASAACSSGASTSTTAEEATETTVPATSATADTGTTQRRFRNDPACEALVRYKLAELAMGTGPPESRASARAAAGAAGRDLRDLVPQFSGQVDQLLATMEKADRGAVTDADRAADREAIEQLGNWYATTCFDTGSGPLP